MRTFVYLVFTCFISAGAFMGALNSANIWPGYLLGFGVWVWFIWNLDNRRKKAEAKRYR